MKKSTSIILIAVLAMLNFSTVKASEITSNFDDSILGGEKKVESTILNETEEIPQQENEMTESGIISNTQQNSKENEEEEIDQENKEIFSEIIQEENTTKSVQSGWVQQDGKWFYYDINGNKLLGWQYIGRDWYYFEPTDQGVMLYDCEKEILGKTYYFGNSGAMERGLVQRPEGWYFTEDGGSKQCGWQKIDGKWHYFDQANQGIMVYGCEKEISGKTYFFDEDGVMKVGWIQCSEGWYYAEGGGVKQTGWQYIGNDWYYFDEANEMYPGVMICNCEKEILGKRYFFGITGAMEKGWIQRAEGWYYAEGGGVKQTGWQYIGSNWYYFDENNESYPGLMVFDCEKTIYGKTYYFTVSGAMRVGWYWENGGWSYYDDNSGQKISGWKNVSGYWYYLDPNDQDRMTAGKWKKISKHWYYFEGGGKMQTDWQKISGLWYYFGSNGGMRTGWQYINGNWYYFYTANDPHGGSEGEMARNVNIDGWQLQDSGEMIDTEEMKMFSKAQIYSSSTRYLILVDRASCKVGIFLGKAGAWNKQYYWSCSPGKPSTPTVSGTFTVQGKGYYFDSGRARCFYYTQFKGNYLFHSVLYAQTSRPSKIIDGRLGMQLSHGCVRLDVNNAKWIYDNIPRGTKVVIY